ncbi:MAK3 [Symbiodinium sp. KB8]|nr:MAK3 [Symbiodinium sp. KB8]
MQATVDDKLVGVIVCRMEEHRGYMRGYIAMVAVDKAFRKQGIGSELAQRVIKHMQTCCDEVVLEAETTNASALRMYQRLGFLRTKRLPKYYMSGSDAFRLKLTF